MKYFRSNKSITYSHFSSLSNLSKRVPSIGMPLLVLLLCSYDCLMRREWWMVVLAAQCKLYDPLLAACVKSLATDSRSRRAGICIPIQATSISGSSRTSEMDAEMTTGKGSRRFITTESRDSHFLRSPSFRHRDMAVETSNQLQLIRYRLHATSSARGIHSSCGCRIRGSLET
jgi:hypothetical protein